MIRQAGYYRCEYCGDIHTPNLQDLIKATYRASAKELYCPCCQESAVHTKTFCQSESL